MALGCALRDGRGCEQSYEGAVRWFELAGQQDDARGQCYHAHLVELGKGAPQVNNPSHHSQT